MARRNPLNRLRLRDFDASHAYFSPNRRQSQRLRNPLIQSALRAVVNRKSVGFDAICLSCFLAAFSPQRPKSSDFARFGVFPHLPQAAGLVHSAASPLSTEPAALGFGRISCSPARWRDVRFWASGGYALGCARKTGHSRDTRLTRVDRRFSAAPVGTLPTAFGFVPAHIPCPTLRASARKTAGWKTEWAGACTEDSHFAFGRPA